MCHSFTLEKTGSGGANTAHRINWVDLNIESTGTKRFHEVTFIFAYNFVSMRLKDLWHIGSPHCQAYKCNNFWDVKNKQDNT